MMHTGELRRGAGAPRGQGPGREGPRHAPRPPPRVRATFPIVAVVGFSSIAFMTATTAIVQVRADPRMHGRVLALQTVLLVGTTPIGGPIMGAVADATNARVPLVIGGAAALA